MPIKRVTAYDGFDLTANGMFAGINADDLFSTWANRIDERGRPGTHPAIGAVAMSARRITVDLTFPNGASAQTINTAFQTLMGGLQPDKPYDPQTPRYLVAQLADGSDTPVQRPAVIEGPLEALSGGINGFRVVFVSADPAWRLVTPATATLANAGANRLQPYNHTFLTNLTGWEQHSVTAGVTYAASRGVTIFDDAAGALLLDITANTAGAGALVEYRNSTLFPAVEGGNWTLAASNRTSNANITPRLRLAFLDVAQSLISSSTETDWVPTANTWTRRSWSAIAPAGTAFVRVILQAYIDTASNTGQVRFDWTGLFEDPDEAQSWDSVSLTNDGHARAWPVLTFESVNQAPGSFPGRYRREIVLTNNADQPLIGEAVEVALGNTTTWVTADYGAASNGANVWFYRDGIEVPRQLEGFNTAYSAAWLYVDHLAAGESATIEVLYGGSGATALTLSHPERLPAFDIRADTVTTTAGSTTTTLELAGAPGYGTDQWANGHALILTGALAGSGQRIASNDADTITLAATIGGSAASGVQVLLRRSYEVNLSVASARHVYDVRQVARDADEERGLWYADEGDTRPSNVRFDTPGAWEPFLYLDNVDEKNQSDVVSIDVGGGDRDYFTILDCDRCGQGVARLANEGAADGIRFSSVFPIEAWQFDGAFKNPNGMCHAFSDRGPTRVGTGPRSAT